MGGGGSVSNFKTHNTFCQNKFLLRRHIFSSDHKHEVSGSNARITLLRLWVFIAKQREKLENDTPVTKRIQRLLGNLSYIQHLAYSMEPQRNAKNILAMYNLTYVFTLDYMKVSVHTETSGITVSPNVLINMAIQYWQKGTNFSSSLFDNLVEMCLLWHYYSYLSSDSPSSCSYKPYDYIKLIYLAIHTFNFHFIEAVLGNKECKTTGNVRNAIPLNILSLCRVVSTGCIEVNRC